MVLLSEFRKTFPGALKLRFPSRKKICRIFFWYKIECNSGNYWTSAFLFSVSETSDCWLEPAVKIFQLSGIPDEWQSEIATVLYVRTKNTCDRPSSMSEGVNESWNLLSILHFCSFDNSLWKFRHFWLHRFRGRCRVTETNRGSWWPSPKRVLLQKS